jgi:hypothetical protein
MARAGVSLTALAMMHAQSTGDGLLILVTISHASLTTPLRYVNNPVDVISRGDTYVALAYDVTLPAEVEREAPTARMTVDGVGRELIPTVRGASSFPLVTIELVRLLNPSELVQRWISYKLTEVAGPDPATVELSLGKDDLTLQRYPMNHYHESLYRGLLRAV